MTERGKKIFLAICIITPFLLYCVYYYSIMVKNAPYRFADFESITFKYGLGDSLVNEFNSKTGDYQYINSRDSLIRTKVRMRKDDLLYLHRKAAELGFWNFPEKISGEGNPNHSTNSPQYYIEFKYKGKAKHVLYDAQNTESPKLNDAAKSLITEISNMINDTRDKDLK
ncbi:hypothetical protein [Daejeonella lutea]|uniref:Uncharacterized protein n=1 Tax=Daejeonella lutea TaxID=572036 RepID=A0A1T5AT81_9SPHI|nr:hypothetical protein [Daejeonella lutea]SKB38214.1 hypothetical protein SAMN05661099_1016 [Daejeonella lutea]